MTDELVLYTNPMSRGRTVRWMLEEVGQPYRVELLEYDTTMKSPAYLALNPMGKVPTLTHGGVVVTEGAAICAYLADAFPQAGLAPAPCSPERGSPERAAYYRWLFFAAGPFEAAVVDTALGLEVPADRRRMTGYGSLQKTLDVLEQAVGAGGTLAGDRFTAADLYVASQIGFGIMFKTIADRPVLSAYVERMTDRPAYRRAAEIDDGLIATRQAGG